MSEIFIDTETTGLWKFKEPANSPNQPHLIQLAAITDSAELNVYVHLPNGATITPSAYKAHGISEDMLKAEGVPLPTALMQLNALLLKSTRIVCHNTGYDMKVLEAAYIRAGLDISIFASKQVYCTMLKATNICRIPGRYGYKWPSLDEAYRYFVDPKGFEGVHDALADVRACRAVYNRLSFKDKLP